MQRSETARTGHGLIRAKRFRTRWMNAARVTADAFSMPYSASQIRSALRSTIRRASPRISTLREGFPTLEAREPFSSARRRYHAE
jgi:hypothetical protein